MIRKVHDPFTAENVDRRRFLLRTIVAFLIIALCSAILFGRLFVLQVGAHDHFTTLSETNRLRVESIPPTRGLILDRNGILLAENRPSYQLEITVEQAGNLEELLERLEQKITLSPLDIQRFRAAVRQRRPFQPVLLSAGLDHDAVARIAVARHELPGVEISARPLRHYPLGEDFAHLVGYVARINEQDLQRIDRRNYSGSAHIGRTGVERFYEEELHGQVGFRKVEVNARGRVIRELSVTPPTPGRDIVLTVDARLQQIATTALGEEKGSIVVIDTASGEILAMVSQPGFDPNLFVRGLSTAQFTELLHDQRNPLFNRALSGQYPPGSTIKPVIALAGLLEGVTTAERRMFAPGYFQIPGHERRYRDWRREGHGWVDMDRAIAVSSDVYFYDLAYRLGIQRMVPLLEAFGLGQALGIDSVGEQSGVLPSPHWKRAVRNEAWFPGETVITGIGQGYMLMTPLQLADLAATLANRGVRKQPHLRRGWIEEPGFLVEVKRPDAPAPIQANPEHWDVIHQSLINAVHARHGTAWASVGRDPLPYSLAGKTGTSQVFSLAADQEYDQDTLDRRLWDHALFMGYAPADNPQIAVAVLVEHGGSGGRVAAPIARQIVDGYLQLEPCLFLATASCSELGISIARAGRDPH